MDVGHAGPGGYSEDCHLLGRLQREQAQRSQGFGVKPSVSWIPDKAGTETIAGKEGIVDAETEGIIHSGPAPMATTRMTGPVTMAANTHTAKPRRRVDHLQWNG